MWYQNSVRNTGKACRTFCFLLDGAEFILVDFEVHGYGRRFDGDTSLLFVFSCICVPRFTSLGTSDDTGFRDERVGEGGFSVVDWDDVSKRSRRV
jgi:hypothetical protein